MTAAGSESNAAITFIRTVPILRIFSVDKAKEFYCGFLGFKVDWEHTFEPGMPVYMQVSRGASAAAFERTSWRRLPWNPYSCRDDRSR